MSGGNEGESVLYEEVLPDAFYSDPDFMRVYSLRLPMRLAHEFSRFVSDDQFTRRFPHLKRMRKAVSGERGGSDRGDSSGSQDEPAVEILIGESQDSLPTGADEYLKEHGVDKTWGELEVPRSPPLTRERFVELSRIWPLSFLKPKFSPEVLSDQTQRESDRLVRLAIRVGEHSFKSGNPPRGCVITLGGRIVAVGEDSRNSEYPWMHSVMKAVDSFSRRVSSSFSVSGGEGEAGVESRVSWDYVGEMQSKYNIPKDEILADSELKGQYLCTNGIVYLSHEPCISCSMALVHSRVSKVFYMHADEERGFLGSKHKLHCISELNHHYRVFRAKGGKSRDTMGSGSVNNRDTRANS